MQYLRNLSIRGKLGAGFGLVLALAVLLGVVMLSELGSVNAGGEYLGRTALPNEAAINLVARDAIDLRRAQLKYVLDPLTAGGTQARSDWTGDQTAVAATLRGLAAHATGAEDRSFERAVQVRWQALQTQTAPLVALATTNAAPPASKLITTTLPTYKDLIRQVNAWLAATNHKAAATLGANSAAILE